MRNMLIALWLLLVVSDVSGLSPAPVRRRLDYLLHMMGVWQGRWSMFAPEPDRSNHRLCIVLRDAAGQERAWHSPEWKQQHWRQRFLGSRWTEYIDNLPDNEAAWPAVLDYMATLTARREPTFRVHEAVLLEKSMLIPAPDAHHWPRYEFREAWQEWRVLHRTTYGEAASR
jgi:hypothetical protein